MPRFALLQNGSDVARHQRSDVNQAYEDCCARLSASIGVEYSFESFYDEGVGPLLDGLNVDDFDCVVLSSNALLSDSLTRAIERRLETFHDYLANGGGLVVLHQWRPALSPFLPESVCPELKNRESAKDDARACPDGRDDPLLHVPFEVDYADLRDRVSATAPERLFFKALEPSSLPLKLKSVLAKNPSELLMTRSDDHAVERLVVTTMPLDWQRNINLLSNCLLFGCAAQPRRLVWRGLHLGGSELLLQWLALDGETVFRPSPNAQQPLGSPDGWLLGASESRLELLVVPPPLLNAVRDHPEVTRFLARGGTLVSAKGEPELPGSSLTALVGSYSERVLAARLYGELRAEPGWRNVESAFNVRNVVCVLALLWEDEHNRSSGAIAVDEVDDLREEICNRLTTPRHQDDVGSSLALAQTASFLEQDRPLDVERLAWLPKRHDTQGPDVKVQVRAVFALWRGQPDAELLGDAAAWSADWTTDSPAPVVRVLDAVALLAQRWPGTDDPSSSTALADAACCVLDNFPAETGIGWISVEATADLVRGLVALCDQVPPDQTELRRRLATHVATGTGALRRALGRYERNPDGVAWLARVTHALVVAERRFPVGLQRLATLQWPDRSDPSAPSTLLPLIDHLGATNKTLRDSQVVLQEQMTAARAGRAMATLFTSVAVVGIAVAFTTAFLHIHSTWGIVGTIAALSTAIIGALAAAFTLLDRWGLLARPAKATLVFVEKVVPIAQQIAKLKTKD